jgi:hypothetical protein
VTSQLISVDVGCFISIIVSISMVVTSFLFNNSWGENYSDTGGQVGSKFG